MWRLTATYLWLRWILTIAYGGNILAGAERASVGKLASLLSSVGFTPAGPPHLGPVLVALWILSLTGFSLIQLLVGLPLYILLFPFTVLLALLYRKTLKQAPAEQTNVAELDQRKRRFPTVTIAASLLIAWFLLYGGSPSHGPGLVGCILSGLVLAVLAYRALDKTSPIDEQDTAAISDWVLKGIVIIRNAAQRAIDEPPKNRIEAESTLRITGYAMLPFRYLTIVFRGRRGRDRVALIMLIEYMVSLVVLALSAILFWALAMRSAVLPKQAISMSAALRLSASHFLPGINAVPDVSLPLWAEFGPALTAFVLFVVYIGPVGSALPVRQDSFLKHFTPLHKSFRKVVQLWHIYSRFMRSYVKAYSSAESSAQQATGNHG